VAKGANPQNACILPILAIIAKLFYKIFYSIINLSVIFPKCCNYGAAGAWGG